MKLAKLAALLAPAAFAWTARPASGAPWRDAYSGMAAKLVADPGAWDGGLVAVLPFRHEDARESVGADAVAERLQAALERGVRAQFVDRRRILDLQDNLRQTLVGLGAQQADLMLGRRLGARLLVSGTITDAPGGTVEVYARLVRVVSEDLLRAASARVPREWTAVAAVRPEFIPSPLREPRDATVRRILPLAKGGGDGPQYLVGERILVVGYTENPEGPAIRVSDWTEPARVKWSEMKVPLDRRTRVFERFSVDLRVGGHRYRIESAYGTTVRVSPRSWLGLRPARGGIYLRLADILQLWVNDVEKRMRVVQVGSNGQRVAAYLESLGPRVLRASLFPLDSTGRFVHLPLGTTILRLRGSRVSSTGAIDTELSKFQFYYSPDAGEVVVESQPH